MQEELLHYVWRLKRFDLSDLRTTENEPVEILHFGEYNRHAGPDFSNARIRIGDTLWAGNVEMHLRASDWLQHGHQDDPAYHNVILHVVLEEDRPVRRPNGRRLPCLELKARIPARLAGQYQRLQRNEHWIPCQAHFPGVSELTLNLWLDRLLVERLEGKTAAIAERLLRNNNDWEETCYQLLARNFGLRVNAEPFERLARATPRRLLARHRDNLFQLESMLFGQSGLLTPAFEDDYPQRLQKEYAFLQKKYDLSPLPAGSWKFMRLRPANFPTVRIAQLATLLHQSHQLFGKMLMAENVRELKNMFDVHLSNYWWTHYRFDKHSRKQRKALGRAAVHLFIINTIAPLLFTYGRHRQEPRYEDKALRFLEALPPEDNRLLRGWRDLGIRPANAYQSQALLQLKRGYCEGKRCLECAVGAAILK